MSFLFYILFFNCVIECNTVNLLVRNYCISGIKFDLCEKIAKNSKKGNYLCGLSWSKSSITKIVSRPKPNGEVRVMLDLSKLNDSVTYDHFKMESCELALDLVYKNCLISSVNRRCLFLHPHS